MRRLLICTLLLASSCRRLSDAEKELGDGAVCKWSKSEATDVATCIRNGALYTCLYVGSEVKCARASRTPAEEE